MIQAVWAWICTHMLFMASDRYLMQITANVNKESLGGKQKVKRMS